jgi:hypothetical protein
MVGGEDRASHALPAGVHGAQHRGVIRNDFGESRGPPREVVGECLEVVEVVPHVLGDAHPVPVSALEALLEGSKEALAAGNTRCDES